MHPSSDERQEHVELIQKYWLYKEGSGEVNSERGRPTHMDRILYVD